MSGLFKMSGGGGGGVVYDSRNPCPRRFSVLRGDEIGSNLVAEVVYPDCLNHEGRKVMVYLDTTLGQLWKRESIDPHFTEDGLAPFARFEPTERGWDAARKLAAMMAIQTL